MCDSACASSSTAASASSGQCAVCSVDAPLKCTACKVTFYCGVEHQRQHWRTHKPICQRPFVLAESAELGRHVIAARDIQARSVIFVEGPLVVGPKWSLEEFEKEVPVFPCVGCLRPVHVSRVQCPQCTWPVCSVDCAGLTDPLRHGVECAVLSCGSPPPVALIAGNLQMALDYYRSDALLALRSVLLQVKYPQKWQELQRLESHEAKRKGTNYYEEAQERIVSYLSERFFDRLPAAIRAELRSIDAATLHRVCGIIEVNGMNINLEHGQEISAVFPTACLLEHSCVPNCMFTFGEHDGQQRVTMLAGRDIRQGEHLSIMYTHMLWGTQMRHEHLQTNKYFVCRCERCRDPTELGTNLSALRCIGDENKTCVGTMLPTDPHDPATEWLCDVCPVRLENDKMAFLLARIEEEVDGLLLSQETTVAEVESLIDKLGQLLHHNHYHLFALRHSLVQMYGSKPGFETDRLSEQQLLAKIEMCEDLLRVVDAIDPHAIRLSLYIGIVLYELHSAVVELERRRLAKAKADGVAYKYDALYVAEGYLVRAKRVLENSGDTPQGRKFVESVVRASESLETLFEGIRL